MIESIISFSDVKVSEVMTPRTEMVCLDLDEPQDVNLQRAIDCGHSRIPVVRQSKDNVVGLLYVKDLLARLYRQEEFTLESVVRKPYLVPHTKKIHELFQEFKSHRMHIAIVLDEHGGTAGLVTIEDIIEEIVGDISDEYEKEEPAPIKRLSSRLVEVDASVHIDDLNEELELEIPEGESYDTMSGFLCCMLGRVPTVGQTLELNGARVEITEADERRVQRLRVHLLEDRTGSGGDAGA
jgi:CBS domain containing-hemolysin-like protein